MVKDARPVPTNPQNPAAQVDDFLRRVAELPSAATDGHGRLMFAMDATASREHTWREAMRIQEEMFLETARLGGLDVQLVYYRGFNECKASRWLSDADALLTIMRKVDCIGGQTQIGRVLRHALGETRKKRVNALVFVGDCMEESVDDLCAVAGELGLLGVPAFLFHEGDEQIAARAFAQIAKLTGGACCRFDASSPQQLKALLGAVAVYAAGGRKALADYSRRQGGIVLQITHQMKGD
jgi:hypothetical protein